MEERKEPLKKKNNIERNSKNKIQYTSASKLFVAFKKHKIQMQDTQQMQKFKNNLTTY